MRRSASRSCSTPRCCATIPSTIIRSSIPPPPPPPPRISPASSPPADTGRLCWSSPGSTGPGGKPGACQDPALPPSLGGKFGDFTLMEPILGGAAAPADAANLVKNGSTQTFMADVIDASHDAAVVVYAFKDGRPVDGFVGALPESQVKQFVGRLAANAGAGPSPIEEALALAQEAID